MGRIVFAKAKRKGPPQAALLSGVVMYCTLKGHPNGEKTNLFIHKSEGANVYWCPFHGVTAFEVTKAMRSIEEGEAVYRQMPSEVLKEMLLWVKTG